MKLTQKIRSSGSEKRDDKGSNPKTDKLVGLLRGLVRESFQSRALQAEILRRLYKLTSDRNENELCNFGASYFSQNGEDGIISEICRRLGLYIKTAVEFGAGNGLENNTLYLLLQDAHVTWVESDGEATKAIREFHRTLIESGRIRLVERAVDRDNVNDILADAGTPADLDLLSIDIDGNDYWVWKAISVVSPKIIVVEYNGFFGPSISWVMDYDPNHRWPGGSTYFGASLKSLERLGREKGYTLVGCDFSGVNAFFLRNELLNEFFIGPFTSEAMYHPMRRAYPRERKTFGYTPFRAP